MRNKQLEDILRSQAWERGHHAGKEEVENIFNGLRYDFREIDALLPFTAEPKFKVGDKVKCIYGDGEELSVVDIGVAKNEECYEYLVTTNDGIEVRLFESSLEKYE